MDPLGNKGNLERSRGITNLGHTQTQRPEASREGRVREVQGGAEEVSVQFRKIGNTSMTF